MKHIRTVNKFGSLLFLGLFILEDNSAEVTRTQYNPIQTYSLVKNIYLEDHINQIR